MTFVDWADVTRWKVINKTLDLLRTLADELSRERAQTTAMRGDLAALRTQLAEAQARIDS